MSDLSLMSTQPTVKHTRSEIRVKNEKAKSTNLLILNNALAQIAAATDPEYRQMRYEGYLRLLECVHVNGVAGAKVTAAEAELSEYDDLFATQEAACGRYGY